MQYFIIESNRTEVREKCPQNADVNDYKLEDVDHIKLIRLRCGCEYHMLGSTNKIPLFPQSCFDGNAQEFQIKIKTPTKILDVEAVLLNELSDVEAETKFEKNFSPNEATFQNKFIDELNSKIDNLNDDHDQLKQKIITISEQNSILPSFPDPFGILKNVEQWVHVALWCGLLIIVIVTFIMVLSVLCKMYGLIDQLCRCRRQSGPQQTN